MRLDALLAVFLLLCAGARGGGALHDAPAGDDGGIAAERSQDGGDATGPFEPVFRTDFERGHAVGEPADAHTKVVFLKNLGNPRAGSLPLRSPNLYFYYEAGEPTDRYARIVDDPTQPGNRVLHYWLRNAVIPTAYRSHTKGRIQTTFNFGVEGGVARLYARQRVYFHPDLASLPGYPNPGDWWLGIILGELWFGAPWEGDKDTSRISLMIYPDFENKGIGLGATHQDAGEVFWSSSARNFAVPTGEWVTLEIGYLMGDAKSGRFVVRAQTDADEEPRVLVDVTGYTYSPHADEPGGVGPIPLTHWNPQKLYSSDNLVHHVRDSGTDAALQVYWDDFEYSDSWPPNWP